MKKALCTAALSVLFLTAVSACAYAGILDKAKTLISGEIAALVLSALLAIIGGTAGVLYRKISRTFREAGEFLTTLGGAIEDNRITRDELAAVIREGREIFAVWR